MELDEEWPVNRQKAWGGYLFLFSLSANLLIRFIRPYEEGVTLGFSNVFVESFVTWLFGFFPAVVFAMSILFTRKEYVRTFLLLWFIGILLKLYWGVAYDRNSV